MTSGRSAASGALAGASLRGALRNLFADALFMPTGLLAIAYLARRLGPADFFIFALAMAVVTPIALAVTLPFAATPHHLAADGCGLATALLRQLLLATGGLVLVWLAADAIAATVALPVLAPALRLFALDIPLFALAQLCGGTIVARGLDRWRAGVNIGRMLSRPLLIVFFVELGYGVQGALLGTVGVSVVHLLLSAPALLAGVHPLRQLATVPTPARDPLPLINLYQRIAERLDLVMLAAIGGSAVSAQSLGIYGVAQFLPTLPVAIGISVLSSLRADLSQQHADRQRDILALAAIPLPFAALAAGSAPEVITLIFGEPYRVGASVLALLCVAATFAILLHTGLALLCATGHTRVALAFLALLLPLAILAQYVCIGRFGSTGAALAMLATSAGGAIAAILVVRWAVCLSFPLDRWAACVLAVGVAYGASAAIPAPGPLVVLKLAVLGALLGLALWLAGVLSLGHRRTLQADPDEWIR